MDFGLIRSVGLTTLGAGVLGHALFRWIAHRAPTLPLVAQMMIGLGGAASGPLLLAPAGTRTTLARSGALALSLAGGLILARQHVLGGRKPPSG